MQPDLTLRIRSNFSWKAVSLELREQHCSYEKRFAFRFETEHGSKKWSQRCKQCFVKASKSKTYTSVRIQFCREYYGVRLQFAARVGRESAVTAVPIVLLRAGIPIGALYLLLKTRYVGNLQNKNWITSLRFGIGQNRHKVLRQPIPRKRGNEDRADASRYWTQAAHDYCLNNDKLPSIALLFSANSQQRTLHISKLKRTDRWPHAVSTSTANHSIEELQRPHRHLKRKLALSIANQLRFLQEQICFLHSQNTAQASNIERALRNACAVDFIFGIAPSANLVHAVGASRIWRFFTVAQYLLRKRLRIPSSLCFNCNVSHLITKQFIL